MNRTEVHQKMVDRLLYEIGSKPRFRCWPRVVGVAQAIGSDRIIRFGINGECDLQGVDKTNGRMFGIEVKTGSAILTFDQKLWRDMLLSSHCIWVLAHTPNEAGINDGIAAALKEFYRQL